MGCEGMSKRMTAAVFYDISFPNSAFNLALYKCIMVLLPVSWSISDVNYFIKLNPKGQGEKDHEEAIH